MKSESARSRVIGRAHDNLSEGEKMEDGLDLSSLKSRRQKSTKSNRVNSKSMSRRNE